MWTGFEMAIRLMKITMLKLLPEDTVTLQQTGGQTGNCIRDQMQQLPGYLDW